MKKILILIIVFAGCNPVKQLERNVAKVERYKKVLGVKPCECDEKVNQYRNPWFGVGDGGKIYFDNDTSNFRFQNTKDTFFTKVFL